MSANATFTEVSMVQESGAVAGKAPGTYEPSGRVSLSGALLFLLMGSVWSIVAAAAYAWLISAGKYFAWALFYPGAALFGFVLMPIAIRASRVRSGSLAAIVSAISCAAFPVLGNALAILSRQGRPLSAEDVPPFFWVVVPLSAVGSAIGGVGFIARTPFDEATNSWFRKKASATLSYSDYWPLKRALEGTVSAPDLTGLSAASPAEAHVEVEVYVNRSGVGCYLSLSRYKKDGFVDTVDGYIDSVALEPIMRRIEDLAKASPFVNVRA